MSNDDEKIFWMGISIAALASACRALDNVGLTGFNALAGSGESDVAGRVWFDGHGGRVEVLKDGRLYANGEFLGHCDQQGRVTNGAGGFAGTLKSDGSFHLPNGELGYRLFR